MEADAEATPNCTRPSTGRGSSAACCVAGSVVRYGSVRVPAGYVEFPKEILRPPRSLAERVYTDIRRWTVAPRGGHFAALEQPQLLAEEIRAFFRPLR